MLLALLFVHVSFADWSDNFNGGLQQPWVFGNFDPLGGSSGTFSAGSVNNELVLTDSRTIFDNGAVTGFGLVPTEVFGDVKMTGRVNPSNNADINITALMLLRGDFANNTFYSAEINYRDGELVIYRADGLGVGSNLVAEPIPGLGFSSDYYLEFSAVGAELTAEVYDAPGGNLLQSVATTDSTYSAGLSGVIVDAQSGDFILPLLGIWDDLTATAILPDGDFNGDGLYDCLDVDDLVADIAAGSNSPEFDLNGDALVDTTDLSLWLAEAGANNLPSGAPYLVGDGNLDGVVDVGDFNVWNNNKFTSTAAWCRGDYNADGSVDVPDFNLWNGNKFTSSGPAAVPEPSCWALLGLGLSILACRRGRHRRE